MNRIWLEQAELFLRAKFAKAPYYLEHPDAGAYRLQHSYRVANIGVQIARKEGFDPTLMALACLLHDVSYCETFETKQQLLDHGRAAAKLARPFFEGLGLPQQSIEQMCLGIAMHVDDRTDDDTQPTAFAKTVGDADNIDRFDAYRIYDNLRMRQFDTLDLHEKREMVERTLKNLAQYSQMELSTATATTLWRERVALYQTFTERLQKQLDASEYISLD